MTNLEPCLRFWNLLSAQRARTKFLSEAIFLLVNLDYYICHLLLFVLRKYTMFNLTFAQKTSA